MPTIIKCKECGHVLAEFPTLPDEEGWYAKLYKEKEGKCPNCHHSLPKPEEYPQKAEFQVEKYF